MSEEGVQYTCAGEPCPVCGRLRSGHADYVNRRFQADLPATCVDRAECTQAMQEATGWTARETRSP